MEEKKVFVRIDKYKELLERIDQIKETLALIEEKINGPYEDLRKKEEEELQEWRHTVEEIKAKIEQIEQHLFEG